MVPWGVEESFPCEIPQAMSNADNPPEEGGRHSWCDRGGGWGDRMLAAGEGPRGPSKIQGAQPPRHLSSQGKMETMGRPEAVGPSEEDKMEGVSRPKPGHAKAEITLLQSHLTTMSVQIRHHGTQRDLLLPEAYLGYLSRL